MSKTQKAQQAGEPRVVFEPVLNVASARSLYGQLDQALGQAKGVLELDGDRVERVDASTLQLLAAFCCAARDAGLTLRWRGVSPALRDAVELLDLRQILD